MTRRRKSMGSMPKDARRTTEPAKLNGLVDAFGLVTNKHANGAFRYPTIAASGVSLARAAEGSLEQLLDWAAGLGGTLTFAVDGPGSYRAGLSSAVRRRDIGVVGVMRTDRRGRRLR